MDYINGGSFNDLRKAGCEPLRGLRLAAEACRAIEVLHDNDIIHRDVTPGNLLLSTDPDGRTRVLIADLGVAKSMIDSVGATMTAGTPSYMAPEQAAGVLPLDRRADIYSLTAVAYALLTGAPPFVTRSIADILARDPDRPPEPLAKRLGAPPSLDGVMVAGLAADRNRRPPTALVLAEGLETIARQMEPRGSGGPSGATGADRPAEATVVTNPNRPPAPMTTPLGYQSLPPGPVPTPPSTLEPAAGPTARAAADLRRLATADVRAGPVHRTHSDPGRRDRGRASTAGAAAEHVVLRPARPRRPRALRDLDVRDDPAAAV